MFDLVEIRNKLAPKLCFFKKKFMRNTCRMAFLYTIPYKNRLIHKLKLKQLDDTNIKKTRISASPCVAAVMLLFCHRLKTESRGRSQDLQLVYLRVTKLLTHSHRRIQSRYIASSHTIKINTQIINE